MSNKYILRSIIISLVIFATALFSFALDYPHSPSNYYDCATCHDFYSVNPYLMTDWTGDYVMQDDDDTPLNHLCRSCHYGGGPAPAHDTHSYLGVGYTTSATSPYGGWQVRCSTCHNPHYQQQFRKYRSTGEEYWLVKMLVDAVTVSATSSTLKAQGTPNWSTDEYVGMMVVPNVNARYPTAYKITGNDSDTLTIKGQVTGILSGDTFAVIYGKIIRDLIKLDDIVNPMSSTAKTGWKRVKFFRETGDHSCVDGDATYDGVCEVCHTETDYHRNNSSANHIHNVGIHCVDCHSHNEGFKHGGGTGVGCGECHGHDSGYGGVTGGQGTYVSHSNHTENDSDDLRGPNVGCGTCHATDNFPNFADGVSYADYKSGAVMTTVCNPCHSSGGTYDGVSDAAVGAKNNWTRIADSESRIYKPNGSLKAGKERWCATCHDESPSQIQSINAPNVIGDEDGTFTYGTGWGFYKTGHGLSSTSAYPASGGVTAGAGKGCLDCHDSTTVHIDGDARTYDDGGSSTTDPGVYRQGYRLKRIGGQEPMLIPWPQNTANSADNYLLCVSCHNSGPFTSSVNMNTNLVTDGINRHEFHLTRNIYAYAADWSGGNTSLINCVVCHNVHGSTRLAMVRDGKLVEREPGLMIWYNNDDIVTNDPSNPNPPQPQNLPLSASTGTIWRGLTSGNLCTHCHGSDNTLPEYRTPFQNVAQAPTLDWTGETNYQSDGVNPGSAASGGTFTFRVKYTDTNNDAPNPVELWVDEDDSGTYEAGEKYVMSGVDSGDTIYTNGRIYSKSLSVGSAGDNTLNYRFYASDGTSDATGAPASGGTITILNNPPALTWTGEAYFTGDGIHPDTGGSGSSFEFRVNYSDTDNQSPSAIQAWIDADDSGTYEPDEKYAMSAVNGSDSTYSDGKLYNKTLTLSYVGDGVYNYRFYASDGSADATGSPASNSTVTVLSSANNPPVLEWIAASCLTDGVKPATGPNNGDFEFIIKYTDPDNQCPPAASDIQAWVDINDNSSYEPGEKYNLTEADVSDTICSDGKLYNVTRTLSLAGDNVLNYRFYATDGTDTAIGDPISNSAVTVVDALKVRTSGGTGWYSSIQSAIDAIDGAHTVLVYEGTYNENLIFNGALDGSTTVRSVCGADSTIISSTGNVVLTQNNTGNVIDGFSITGGTIGLYINAATATVTNSKIYGNINSAAAGGGVYVTNAASTLTISNSEIYSNSAASGGGIFYNSGTNHVISNSIIRDNTATGSGGGIYPQNATLTITNSTVRDNSAVSHGGGFYNNASSVDFSKCKITGNTSSALGGAMYLANASASADLENCIVTSNQGTQGGMIYTNGGTANIINSTVAANQATTGSGGAFRTSTTSAITVRNSILWNNMAATDGHLAYFNGGTLNINDSVIASGGDGVYTDAPYMEGTMTLNISGYTSEHDPLFADASNGDYHVQASSDAIDNANATYAPADDIDGESRPQGSADDIGADEYTSDWSAPVLSWTGETNYASDGVNPNNAASGSSFEFRVNYTDADNEAPSAIQVWVDEDDSGTYESDEKYNMTAVGIDNIYNDGKLYTKTLTLSHAGDDAFNYRFYASDGAADATGSPTSNGVVSVTNNYPVLSWTGEADYASDGVDPNINVTSGSYEFRIDYTDEENTAPSFMEVWVDEDDSGTYEPGEKYVMTATDGGDIDYTDGKRYAKTLSISYTGDGILNYRFYASDGTDDATGAPASNSTLTVANVPLLSWTGEANYISDGVNPNSAVSGSSFEFRVSYTDAENDAPTSIQAWVDEDDSGTYTAGEKYDMTAVDGGDTDYTDGKLYTKTLPITKAGDNTLNYRFYAADGSGEAAGDPTSNNTLTVTNNIPALSWTGETNYVTDGVDPNSGGNGADYIFRAKYTDADDEAPGPIEVWVDEDDSGTYTAGEKYSMTVSGGNGDYTDGEVYTKTLALSYAGDGVLNYRFYASDGTDAATGDPVSDNTVTVSLSANSAPALEWYAGSCRTEGVRPSTGAGGADFEFWVEYTDGENDCPPTANDIQVWIDENDNTSYDAGEKYDLTEDDAGDTNCADGKIYKVTRAISFAGDGSLNHRFYASDGTDPATGTPTSDSTVNVVNTAYKVRPSGGTGWYSTIANALTASPASSTVLVYPNADFTAATYAGGLSNINKTNRTLQSVCGADLTVISGGGTVYNLQGNDGAVIDGFTITGGTTYGIYSNSDSLTVKNSKIHTNPTGIHLNNGCNPATIQNTSIYSNTSYGINSPSALNLVSVTNSNIYNNGGGITNGPGINLNGGAGTHIITNVSLTGNTTTGNGGAIYCVNCVVTIDNSTINDNTAGSGGALYFLNPSVNATITDTFIQGNEATGTLGGAIYMGNGAESLTNVMLTGNKANTNGGAIYINGGTSNCLFCTLSGNYAGGYGGALYQNSSTQTNIWNSIVYNNDALNGGNYKQIFATSPRYTYVDVYNTLIDQIPGANISGPPDQRSSYENMGGNLHEGTDTNELPYFVNGLNPASAPATGGDYRICGGVDDPAGCTAASYCIDAGSGSYTSDHDIYGSSRPLGAGYDMGAHEKE
ncbi:MAG: right-handed parallel beta-helix repeat-containing protein [Nitrospirae bacterium]|nr:right-handed parallel beta-helix repeat-containing protein [Nitrospirota bacterium]